MGLEAWFCGRSGLVVSCRLARVLGVLGSERAQKEEHDDTVIFGRMNQYLITVTLFSLGNMKEGFDTAPSRRGDAPPGGKSGSTS